MGVNNTLLLCCEAFTQSWGTAACVPYTHDSAPRPTKSGILGLVANAMGRTWDEHNEDLRELSFSVRADRPGLITHDAGTAGGGQFRINAETLIANHPELAVSTTPYLYGVPRDPQTKNGVREAKWTHKARGTVQYNKYYVADGAFYVGLTSSNIPLLEEISDRLDKPKRTLYFGRKGNHPARRIVVGMLNDTDAGQWGKTFPLHPRHTTVRPYYWWEDTAGLISMEQPVYGSSTPRSEATFLAEKTVMPPLGV